MIRFEIGNQQLLDNRTMTVEEAMNHNKRVINDIVSTLVETGKADPIRMMSDPEYAVEMVTTYIEAANLTRSAMNMPPLVIYSVDDVKVPAPEPYDEMLKSIKGDMNPNSYGVGDYYVSGGK